ncbi:hypothetical protein [Kribbella sp. DT2]|uniref:hypothetical protein n=1 Tax=Kribbella sp. DT2 TaxID=3393427 RepID=UPI003CEC3368
MTRPGWADGSNYDRTKLGFFTATKAFTIGESLLGGPDLLGADGPDVELAGDFTSCTITETTTVEDGLFVHRETPVCSVSATLPEIVELDGKRLSVKYGDVEVFRGTLKDPSWTESVDLDREHLAGNTPVKTFRVSMRATNGEERLANAATPARNFLTATDVQERIASWTGLEVDVQLDLGDFPLNLRNIGQDDGTAYASWWKYVTIADQTPTLGETIRSALRLWNRTYQLTSPGRISLWPNNRWLTKVSADAGAPLEFTDEAITPVALAGDDHIGQEARVGYSERDWGTDADLWTDSVKVTFSNGGTDFYAGPFRAGSAYPTDTEVDLGPSYWHEATPQADRTTRIIVSTLPIKSRPQATTRTLSTPLQTIAQLDGVIPGMAKVTANGGTENVAVLGRTHRITPYRWLVDYELGPHHLLDRQSDLDPGPIPDVGTIAPNADPNYLDLQWVTPYLPAGVSQWWVRVFYADLDVYSGLTSFDVELTSNVKSFLVTNAEAGDPVITTVSKNLFPLGVPVNVWVNYSTNAEPGQGDPSAQLREGQPGRVGVYVRT